jgi:hypothetical protein
MTKNESREGARRREVNRLLASAPDYPSPITDEELDAINDDEPWAFEDMTAEEIMGEVLRGRRYPAPGRRRPRGKERPTAQEIHMPDPEEWSRSWHEMAKGFRLDCLQKEALARFELTGPISLAELPGFLREKAGNGNDGEPDSLTYLDPAIPGGRGRVNFHSGFWSKDLWFGSEAVTRHPLYWLKDYAVSLLSGVPMLDEAEAVAYLLCDWVPPRLGARLSVGGCPDDGREPVTFRITVRDPQIVTPAQVEELYSQARRHVFSSRVSFRPWPARMVAFVKEQRDAKRTWPEVLADWNELYPEHQWKNWRSLQASYRWQTRKPSPVGADEPSE